VEILYIYINKEHLFAFASLRIQKDSWNKFMFVKKYFEILKCEVQ